jgi:hypothetical protein
MIRRARMPIAHLKKRMDVRFKTLDKRLSRRFASVDARFDGVDARLDRVDVRFDRVDARFDSIGAKLDALIRAGKDQQDHLKKIVDNHEERLKDLERPTGT